MASYAPAMLVIMVDVRNTVHCARARLRAAPRGRLIFRIVADVVDIGVVDRAMTLAAQAFTSLVPVMITIGTLGAMDPVSEALSADYGLDLTALDDGPTDSSAAAFGVVGVLMLVVSATSYARALGRIYGRIWSLPIPSFRQGWRWLLVIVAVASGSIAIGAARVFGDVPLVGPVLVFAAQFVVWLLVWTAVPTLLVPRGISPLARWSTGVLSAAGLTVLQIGSAAVLPRIMNSAERQFGFLGMVFALIGWLFVYSAIVVVAAIIVHAVARDIHHDVDTGS